MDKILILLMLFSTVVAAEDLQGKDLRPSEETRKELEKVFTPEEAKQIDQVVRKQILDERRARAEAKCNEDIKKYRDRLVKDPQSEYNTWKLQKTLKECGSDLNNKKYTEESKQLKNKQNKMLHEKSIRQFAK